MRLVQTLFTRALPIPVPLLSNVAGASIWRPAAGSISAAQQSAALTLLHQLGLHYMAAVQSTVCVAGRD